MLVQHVHMVGGDLLLTAGTTMYHCREEVDVQNKQQEEGRFRFKHLRRGARDAHGQISDHQEFDVANHCSTIAINMSYVKKLNAAKRAYLPSKTRTESKADDTDGPGTASPNFPQEVRPDTGSRHACRLCQEEGPAHRAGSQGIRSQQPWTR